MINDSICNFFSLLNTLDEASRREIEGAGVEVAYQSQQVIYEQGTAADALYIVSSGMVEAITFSPDGKQSRLVAVMSRGDFFGDLAIFTENPRLATVRTRDATRLLCIEKAAFLRLMKKIPELGLFFSRNLARRLHGTSMEAHHKVYAIDLTGNLQRFDLLTIVQAITGMGHTGELQLKNPANQLLGSFFFQHGKVQHARFGHLLGVEAIWQGFVESASEGTFSFKMVDKPTMPFLDEHRIDIDSTNLLLQGVGKRDTYQAMPETLRLMKGQLTRMTDKLEWKGEENRILSELIWSKISDKPQPLINVWRQLNYSAMSFLEVVMELGMSGQAELFVAPEDL